MSLGSVAYAPLAVFYRSTKPIQHLSQLKGMRLAIGREGSGTRFLNLFLLKSSGIELNGPTRLFDLSGEAAAEALLTRKIDCVMLLGDAASPAIMRKLIRSQSIRLMDFTQADAYTRRYR